MIWLLALLFFVTALLYAAAGFGGGSTYNALLVVYGTDYTILPVIALICNIIVVAGGVVTFHRHGHLNAARLAPYLAASIPAAWLGGRLHVPEALFVGLLGLLLVANSLAMIVTRGVPNNAAATMPQTKGFDIRLAAIAMAIGFLAGLVGIGGGIFLAPVLYRLNWGSPKAIAASASLLILMNSAAGLFGQLMKAPLADIMDGLSSYLYLFPAVALGGLTGSLLANRVLPGAIIRQLTALLLFYVGARLLWRWVQMMAA